MRQYLDLLDKIYHKGEQSIHRNGNAFGVFGETMVFDDISRKFPVVTTKEVNLTSIWAELLCFLRGQTNAKDFRAAGTKIWDANADKDPVWLASRHRAGEGDLGRIYSEQWRAWRYVTVTHDGSDEVRTFDQIKYLLSVLKRGIGDNRRAIVTGYNPGEMIDGQMALPPCHMFCQFHVGGEKKDRLDLTMYQRSADMPLGVPFNISSYATLAHIIGRIVGLKPRKYVHILGDAHIYANQMVVVPEQLRRNPKALPTLHIHPELQTLEDFMVHATVEDFQLVGYKSHPPLKYPFSV